MQICPCCASENIFFSRKRSKYFCEDCETGFDTPEVSGGMRVFLSYGHDKNAKVVQKIKAYLVEKGYDVWIDTSEIPAGRDWHERITNGLMACNGVISFLSRHSVRNPGVCLDELKIAVCLKHAYIKTVLLESEADVEPPAMVRNIQWIDMSSWESVSQEDWDTYFAKKMDLLLEALDSDEAKKFNEELELLSRELKVSNSTAKEQRMLRQAFTGRSWLMERVEQWLQAPNREPFLLCGVPGSGKSAFAANYAQFNPNVLASLFLEWDHTEMSDINAVVRQLAFRLAATLPDYRRMLVELYSNKKEKENLDHYSGVLLFDHIILNPLQCCIDGERDKGVIVIDGLDETISEVAELLIRKAAQLPNWIKVLFTSRRDAAILPLFDKENTVMLDQALSENREDICAFLAYRLGTTTESDDICRLADKCEGSFMYAVAFCDAVKNGSMSLSDAATMPSGLHNFYYTLFKRTIKDRQHFMEVRPFLELLCVEEYVPVEAAAQSLGLDHYGLWELRLDVKSLVTDEELARTGWNAGKTKVIRLVHQSIREWLTDPEKAGEFFIDTTQGYRRLASWSEACTAQPEVPEPTVLGEWMNKKLETIDLNNITDATVKEFNEELEKLREATRKEYESADRCRALRSYAATNYIKWLILGGACDKAKEILIDSFNLEREKQNFDALKYTRYYDYYEKWRWADLFPAGYPVDELAETLKKMIAHAREYMVSRYAHRSLQISLLILRHIMDSGRYADVFFDLMSLNFAGYFMSQASDDGETRDGWDKYYMAKDANICLKKLDKKGILVPEDVRSVCEKMKLTYNYERRNPFGGMFYNDSDGCWAFGILCEPELFKDICTAEVSGMAAGDVPWQDLLVHYNTKSLCFYLACSDEEDMLFVARCVKYSADLAEACHSAISYLEKSADKNISEEKAKRIENRMAFIRSLL